MFVVFPELTFQPPWSPSLPPPRPQDDLKILNGFKIYACLTTSEDIFFVSRETKGTSSQNPLSDTVNFLKSQLGLKLPGLGNFPISNTVQISYLALKDVEVNSMMMGFSRDHPGTKSKSDRLLKICNLSHRPGFVRVPHNNVCIRTRGDQPFLKEENIKLI